MTILLLIPSLSDPWFVFLLTFNQLRFENLNYVNSYNVPGVALVLISDWLWSRQTWSDGVDKHDCHNCNANNQSYKHCPFII